MVIRMSSTTEIKADRHYGVREPWRFRCPECEAPRSRIRRRRHHDQCNADDPDAPMYCDKCSTGLWTLHDEKEEREVQQGTRDVNEEGVGDGLSDVNPYDWKL